MTGKELLQTVAQMGFARCLEDNESYFYRAVNLSLSRICRLFPLLGSLSATAHAGEKLNVAEKDAAFLCFPASPIFGEVSFQMGKGMLFREGCDYLIRDKSLFFLRDLGNIEVYYVRRAQELTRDNAEENIDVHPAAESLLPLLVASYLWLDDNGELATHYLKLYHTEAEELRRLLYRHGSVEILSTNGWDKS